MVKIKINNNEEDIPIGIIEEFGQVQFEIFPKIKNAVGSFKSQNRKNILDLGCGLGWNSIFLAKEGFDIYAGDICKEYIDTLRDKANKMNLRNINCKELDMKDIPYEDNSFDVVICTSALVHGTLKEIKMIINEIYRVLKPDGILIADLLSVEDESFGMGEKIELFKLFKEVCVYRRNYIFDRVHEEVISKVYDIECIK